MTLREKAISTAYTGISFCQGEELGAFYEYAEKLMGHPIYTFEYARDKIWEELHRRSKEDFKKMCAGEVEE